MKKIVLFVILTLGWLGLTGQSLVYGPLDRTGFQKVLKGAFWKNRPWAKIIYEGGTVDGFQTEILKQDHFVMFATGENNPLDRNYIIFPEGEIIIEKEGIKFAAICGNKIQSIRPVSEFSKMLADTLFKEKIVVLRDTVYKDREILKVLPKDLEVVSEKTKSISDTTEPSQKWLKRNWWVWPLAAAVLGTAGGFVFPKKGHYWYGYFPKPVPVDEGGPVGVPTHPADTGGPAGTDPFGGRGR